MEVALCNVVMPGDPRYEAYEMYAHLTCQWLLSVCPMQARLFL